MLTRLESRRTHKPAIGDRHNPRSRPVWIAESSQSAMTERCTCGGGCVRCRTAVQAPGDAHEREADHAADAFVTWSLPTASTTQTGPPHHRLTAAAPHDVLGASVRAVATSRGTPLPDAARQKAEAFFGTDFSTVRVHADGPANASARELSAQAYTAGEHVAFAAGNYRPGSAFGDRLLAHELAHVVQQRGGSSQGAMLSRAPATIQRQATIPDFLSIAQRLHDAVTGLGTDEATIFTALGELGGDQQAGDELKRVYQNIHGQNLEADIRGDLSGADLTRAFGLLNPSGKAPPPPTAARTGLLRAGVRSIARSGNASMGLHPDPASGKIRGYEIHQDFIAQFEPTANAADYAIVQWIKGEMFQPSGGGRGYWPASLGLYGRGDGQPWRFTDWIIDTPDADPRFGSDRGLAVSVPTTTFDDAPGVIADQGTLPAGHHWEVDARIGIYPWGADIPTYVAGWESIRPIPLVEATWGWTIEVEPNQIRLSVNIR